MKLTPAITTRQWQWYCNVICDLLYHTRVELELDWTSTSDEDGAYLITAYLVMGPRAMATTLFRVAEFTVVVCIPILIGQFLWLWAIKAIDEALEPVYPSAPISISTWSTSSNTSQQQFQFTELKLLCVIEIQLNTASALDHRRQVTQLQASWGHECHGILFVHCNLNSSRRRRQLKDFYRNQVSRVEHGWHWLVHVEPTTYIFIRNLKYLVSGYDYVSPVVIGRDSTALILSLGAVLKLLVGNDQPFDALFSKDVNLQVKALKSCNISVFSTKDSQGREMFLEPFGIGRSLNGSVFNFNLQLRLQNNLQYASPLPVSAPLTLERFVTLDYLVKRLKVGDGNLRMMVPQLRDPASRASFKGLESSKRNESALCSSQMTKHDLQLNYLSKEVRVLCLILTGPSNHIKKALHVKRTWGRRCNILVFLSSTPDPVLKSTAFPYVKEGREYLWKKMQEGFKHAYKHFWGQFDWVLKADDDTYVVMENLRLLLQNHKPNDPMYLGLRLKGNYTHPWVTGGAGYALSKSALKILVENSLYKRANETRCPIDLLDVPEDVFISLCLHFLGIPYVDTRDHLGRQRFFQHTVKDAVNGQIPPFFYEEYQFYPLEKNMNCCSSSAISFHYIEPFQLYEMEYIIYELNVHGNLLLSSAPPTT